MTTETEAEKLERCYLEEGYPIFIAEALGDMEIGPVKLADMSLEEVMDQVLSWQGIIGYTSSILGAISFLEAQGKK